MTTELQTNSIIQLLSWLLASRTDPGHGHVIWSAAEFDDSLRRLLDLTDDTTSQRRAAAFRSLRNQLVHTEVSSPAASTLQSHLAAAEPRVRRDAAQRWAETAARALEHEWSQVPSHFEALVNVHAQRRDDEAGLTVAISVANGFLEHLTAGADILGKLEADEAIRLGHRAAEQVLAAARWSQVVGDRLDTTQTTRLLGVTRQALGKRQKAGSLLGLPGDGTTWYPTWQFDVEAASIHPAVRDLIGAFRDRLDDVDPLVVAAWATTPQDEDLAGDTPAQWLQAGRNPDQLRRAAERTAARLAR